MRWKRRIKIAVEWSALAVLLVLATYRFSPQRPAPPSAANARSFTLTGLDGKPISPSALQGKAILLNFWAPWCLPCRAEIPWLQNLQNEDRGKLVVVGVVADPGEYSHAAAMMQHKGITYLLAQDSTSLERAFGNPTVLPASFYISPSSHVVHTVTGVVPEPTMRRYAKDAISQN